MLERVLFIFYITVSPILFIIRLTKIEWLGFFYKISVYVRLVPIIWLMYLFNLVFSWISWKWKKITLLFPKIFGYKTYNKEYVEIGIRKILGTEYCENYISDNIPKELIFLWRKDKVYHNYISSIIDANLEYYKVKLNKFDYPAAISDEDLIKFIFGSQITHYLVEKNDCLEFDMSFFQKQVYHPNVSFDVSSISIDKDLKYLTIKMIDGEKVSNGDKNWDLAKIYFMSNTMVFFILGAHLHHHLFFAETGSASLFNKVSKESNFYKLLYPHTAYIIMLNDQFKNNPLSLRETPGFLDKFLYSCIGYLTPDSFYKLGYENALNLYSIRSTHTESETKRANIVFSVPFSSYLDGSYVLNKQLNQHFKTVKNFVDSLYDDLLIGKSKHEVIDWISDVCKSVNVEVENTKDFYTNVISTYIWYVSFVHSMEHYQFFKHMQYYCLLIREPFSKAKTLSMDKVFTQYDLWKSKHIVLTFGKNHLNKNISESYSDVDYKFNDESLKHKQDYFKSQVLNNLKEFDISPEAIALSIRY